MQKGGAMAGAYRGCSSDPLCDRVLKEVTTSLGPPLPSSHHVLRFLSCLHLEIHLDNLRNHITEKNTLCKCCSAC